MQAFRSPAASVLDSRVTASRADASGFIVSRIGRLAVVTLLTGTVALLPVAAASDTRAAAPPAAADLIRDLGSSDYAVREQATVGLERLGADAVDPLLTAAEVSGDLEVALRARWLLQAVPLAAPHDSPAAAELIARYERGGAAMRRRIAHRLLRLEGDAGIEPLARLARLDRDTTQARLAVALLAREWRPGDAYWPGIADRITVGIGASTRPAARFLRALVAFSRADQPAAQADPLAEAAAMLAILDRAAGRDAKVVQDASADDDALMVEGQATDDQPALAGGESASLRILRRCLIEMLVTAGRRDDARTQAAALFGTAGAGESAEEADVRIAADVVWLAEHGLPEAVLLLESRWPGLTPDAPIAAYAAALAVRRAGAAEGNAGAGGADAVERAAAIADRAFEQPRLVADEFTRRIQAGLLLAKWGAADWATREYMALVADERTPAAEFALASILFAEFLHDQGDDARAAAVLGPVITGRDARANEDGDRILPRLQRDPASVASRKLYFEACDAAAAGRVADSRRLLRAAVQVYPKDVDSLIALYRHENNTPEERAEATARVARALRQIDDEIQALPEDPNGYNEYAWLVSNTEGDVAKALRYSRLSLQKSFDSASYLDTLAHCQAAAGDAAGAVRTQSLALRMEPHNRTILRNLLQFQARAAAP
jgi:hypothetical protein